MAGATGNGVNGGHLSWLQRIPFSMATKGSTRLRRDNYQTTSKVLDGSFGWDIILSVGGIAHRKGLLIAIFQSSGRL